MTRTEEFQAKMKSLFKWNDLERRKIDEQLKAQGKYREGLDTNQKYYREHVKEFNRRFYELAEKYKDLPPDTKIIFGDN